MAPVPSSKTLPMETRIHVAVEKLGARPAWDSLSVPLKARSRAPTFPTSKRYALSIDPEPVHFPEEFAAQATRAGGTGQTFGLGEHGVVFQKETLVAEVEDQESVRTPEPVPTAGKSQICVRLGPSEDTETEFD